MTNKKLSIILLSSLLVLQLFASISVLAVTVNNTNITPSLFSPDGNGIRDTTTITFTSTSGQTLYLNIFYNQSQLVRSDLQMTENPSGTYKATWDGKDDNVTYVQNEGTYTIRVTDAPGGGGGTTVGTVTIDLTPPNTPSISIDSGAEYATSTGVNLTISASDASQMHVSNSATSDFSNVTWANVTSPKSWTLSTGDGTKTVYLYVRDTAGNINTSNDAIKLDTTNPTCSLNINSGAIYTNTTSVTLTITASDANSVEYMRFKNNTNNWTSWESYATTKNWTLTNTEGERTVYVMVKDGASNTKTASDKITLDMTAPSSLSISINSGASYTNSRQVNLSLSATGASKIYLSNDGTTWIEYDYATSKTWNLTTGNGLKTVYYKAADGAGNNASQTYGTITLDTTSPSPVTLNTPADGATVTTQTPNFNWSDSNSDTKNYYIQILQSGSAIQSNYVNTTSYTASTLSSGTYTWKVTVYDRANNSATSPSTGTRSFTISITGLAIPTPTYPTNGAYFNNTNVNPVLRWSTVTNATSYRVQYGTSQSNLSNTSSPTNPYYELSSPFTHGTTIYWQVQARNTTTSTNYSTIRSFTIDTQPPTGLSISINNGDTYTTSRTVTLTLNATGATGRKISNTANFSGTSWETYTASKSWNLTSGDGTKTAYFKARDNAVGDYGSSTYANINGTFNDTIILDTTAPSITSPSPSSGGTTTTTTNLAVRATLADTTSGINTSTVTMIIDASSVNATVTTTLVRYVMPTASTGTHTVNITATDNAGNTNYLNWSFTVSSGGDGEQEQQTGEETTTADNAPSISGILHTPTTITDKNTVTISATVTDDNSLESVDLYWNDGTLHSKQMTLKPQTDGVYSATIGPFTGETTVTYYIVALDNASQETTSVTNSFTVQKTTIDEEPEEPEEEPEEPISFNVTIATVTAGETKNVSLVEFDTALEEIEITAANDLTDVKISIEKLVQKPQEITTPTKTVYAYINIETDANQSDISSLKIKFKVEKTWITSNNIDKNTIILMRYHNNAWQELTTTLTTEDDTYVYYEAETTGLSTFAIVGSEAITVLPLFMYIAIIAAVIAAIAVIVILYKKKIF